MNDKNLDVDGQVTGNSNEGSNNSDIVYLLTNEAMPGLVKIGMTAKIVTQIRIDQFYDSSVPVPFECVLAIRVDKSIFG